MARANKVETCMFCGGTPCECDKPAPKPKRTPKPKAQPFQTFQNRLCRLGGRARAVGVFDPQQELAATATGIQPVEQRRAGAADMQIAGGRGGETGDDSVGHGGAFQSRKGEAGRR